MKLHGMTAYSYEFHNNQPKFVFVRNKYTTTVHVGSLLTVAKHTKCHTTNQNNGHNGFYITHDNTATMTKWHYKINESQMNLVRFHTIGTKHITYHTIAEPTTKAKIVTRSLYDVAFEKMILSQHNPCHSQMTIGIANLTHPNKNCVQQFHQNFHNTACKYQGLWSVSHCKTERRPKWFSVCKPIHPTNNSSGRRRSSFAKMNNTVVHR